jgi:hypothetical protein
MTEIIRSRDCVIRVKDDAYTVAVDSTLVSLGWPGGQGVMWVGSVDDEFLVTFSNGHYGGFLVWGSDEAGDDFASSTRNQPHYQFATMFSGAAIISTTSYERYTLASRLVPPLVLLTYNVNQPLYLSLRGLWTNEDELTISANPTAPCPLAGVLAQIPKASNRFFLGVQTIM